MAYKLRNPLTSQEFDVAEMKLINEFNGRYHVRGGVKDNVDYYMIAFVDKENPGVIFGQLTGPHKNYASFQVSRGQNFPRYKIAPAPGNRASSDVLESQIRHGMKKLYSKVLAPRYSGPMRKDNWKGFYPKRSRGLKVGPQGLKVLNLAIAKGEIDQAFKDVCVENGIYMEYI